MIKNPKLKALRSVLRREGFNGIVIPRQDEYQGEYVAPYAERLRWLTGFTGSWGLAIVTLSKAAIFVDGRYTSQVKQQIDVAEIKPHHLTEQPPTEWLSKNLKAGDVIGFDPWLITAHELQLFEGACRLAGACMRPVKKNLIDLIWQDQPPRPNQPISTQPTQFAGETVSDKRGRVAALLKTAGADATVLTEPDQVSWAFNIRGRDVPHTPVVLAFAIMHRKGKSQLFIEADKLPEDVAAHLKAHVQVRPPQQLEAALKALGKNKSRVMINSSATPQRIKEVLVKSKAQIVEGRNVTMLLKAQKNLTEQEGARASHKRDGAAMVRFLRWFDEEAPKGHLNEWQAAEQLKTFRSDNEMFRDLSFSSIPAFGAHAAIPHYSVTPETAAMIERGIFLIDSGGQYQDGTTDITRTLVVGEPSAEMKDRFTRVLKGMIAISRLYFPLGTFGGHIDALARQHLWATGLDYDHGTGHGVGSYLSVHEGPARISRADRTTLLPGMILSNEPGYYKEGEYGIRIENLLLVKKAETLPGGERPMLSFETLTLCPIERRLIDAQLLTHEEVTWLNAYHARVAREIGPLLNDEDSRWLEAATQPL